jgi:flagellar basal body P-ring formation protein FlgA
MTRSPSFRALLVAASSAILVNGFPLRGADGAGAFFQKSAAADLSAVGAAQQTPFTRDLLIAALTRCIGSHFNLEGDLQLELLRPWTPPARVATVWELDVLEYPNVTSSSMMVRCRVLADATAVADTTFVVRAQLWRDAWSTRQPLTVGHAFDASLLEARRVDLLRDRDALPAAVGDRTYIFARAVPAGRMLTWRDIARRPLVKKGDLVDVSAVDGVLSVTMKALAMENGAQGDTVTVRNPVSRKDFAAMVVDENRVQVRF